ARPGRWDRVDPVERVPVGAAGNEGLDRDGALRAGRHLVRRVGRDAPRAARQKLPLLVADPEAHRAGGEHADLLILVRVLRDDRVRLELDGHGPQPRAATTRPRTPSRTRCGRIAWGLPKAVKAAPTGRHRPAATARARRKARTRRARSRAGRSG